MTIIHTRELSIEIPDGRRASLSIGACDDGHLLVAVNLGGDYILESISDSQMGEMLFSHPGTRGLRLVFRPMAGEPKA